MTGRQRRGKAGTGEGGFSLIELLVALAIGAFVLAAVYSTFSLSHDAVGDLDASLVRLQEVRGLLDVMRREVEAAYYDRRRDYTAFMIEDRDYYGSQASSFSFTAFSPVVGGVAGIQYYAEAGDGVLVLFKKMRPLFPSRAGEGTAPLVEGIETFSVEARYQDEWVRMWDSGLAGRIPDEIRISLTLKARNTDRGITISETARPRIGKQL